ncbi:MAG: histidinol-phosphatase [Treponema sp.]|nr:histidinol-phosphatase [Treponema sp.]
MLKTNYHTHTSFCDGKGKPEEIIAEAINKGFDILGFSSHSMYPFASSWHIAPREFENYTKAVRAGAKKYQDKIKVLCGFEADYVPGLTCPDFDLYYRTQPDFLIGSVHYIFTEKGRLAVDYNAESLQKKIQELFNGNAKEMTIRYFELQREMLSKGNFTIIGHADLVRKNNGKLNMFSENDSWYREEIKLTADAIKKAGVIAEINTGAISRGTMNDVYPSHEFLSLLQERGVPVTLSSDSHQPANLDAAFDRALEAAVKAGYRELAYIESKDSIKFQRIEN